MWFDLLGNIWIALLITIILEWVVFMIFMKKSSWNILFSVILINLFTWPIANLIIGLLNLNFWLVELVVILIEIPLIKLLLEIDWKKASLVSIVANLVTALVGFFVLAKF